VATITCIDNRCALQDIGNFIELPKLVRDEIQDTELRSFGFQELNGYNNRTCMLSMGGYWTYPTLDAGMKINREGYKEKFFVTSYGSHNFQWDGTTLKSTVKIYV